MAFCRCVHLQCLKKSRGFPGQWGDGLVFEFHAETSDVLQFNGDVWDGIDLEVATQLLNRTKGGSRQIADRVGVREELLNVEVGLQRFNSNR